MVKSTFCILFAAFLAGPALATPIEFSTFLGERSAWASFEVQGDNLIVMLANTSEYDVLIPDNVLTAVFFSSTLPLSLQPMSAVVPEGSEVLFGTTEPGGSVGGEWAYASGLTGAPGGLGYGISSSGLDLFGPHDLFAGSNLQGPAGVDGLQYGIVPAADDPATGNAPVTGRNALIRDRVVFTLSGVPADFDPSLHIGNVFFQYGTSLSEGGMNIPEPRMLTLFAVTGLLFIKRRAPQSPSTT